MFSQKFQKCAGQLRIRRLRTLLKPQLLRQALRKPDASFLNRLLYELFQQGRVSHRLVHQCPADMVLTDLKLQLKNRRHAASFILVPLPMRASGK